MNNRYASAGIWTTTGFIIERRRPNTPGNVSIRTINSEYTDTTHALGQIDGVGNGKNNSAKGLPPIMQPRINTLVGVEPKFRRKYYHKAVMVLLVLLVILVLTAIIILGILIYKISVEKICRTKECLRTAASLIYSMDEETDPCEDFYKFTCGRWSEEHPRPESVTSNDWFREAQAKIMRGLRAFLKLNNTFGAPDAVLKARVMYKSCMNTKLMDEREMEPLLNYLNKFQLPLIPSGLNLSTSEESTENYKESLENFNWLKSVVMIKKYLGMDLIIGFDVFTDPLNGTLKRIALGTPEVDTALPFNNDDLRKILNKMRKKFIYDPEEVYIEDMDDLEEETETAGTKPRSTLNAYLVYIKKMMNVYLTYIDPNLDTEGYQDQAADLTIEAIGVARKIYQLKESAENSSKSSKNPIDDIVYVTVQELQAQTDELIAPKTLPIWQNYLHWIMTPITKDTNTTVETWNISSWKIITSRGDIQYLQTLAEYLLEVPKEHLEFYIWLSAVEELILHTTSEMRLLHAEYLSTSLGTENNSPRSLYCTHAVNSLMGMAVSYALADEDFARHKLPNVRRMLDNIRQAFNDLVRSTSWMDESTKRETLKKSADMKSFVGYPDWIRNATALDRYYAEVKVDADTHLENMIGILTWEVETMLKHFNESERVTWATSPSNVNAFHIFQENAITLNYGSIGTILGHELTHGFDDAGRMFDKNGNMLQWWTNETITEYINRTECFIQQYNQYYLDDIDEYINGELTLGENIADNGGMREAYYAYKLHVIKNGKETMKLPGLEHYTHEQLFFISFGNLWCETYTPAASFYALEDTHCPGRIRLKGVLTNSKEFARVFQCPLGSSMNPKNKKCRIW